MKIDLSRRRQSCRSDSGQLQPRLERAAALWSDDPEKLWSGEAADGEEHPEGDRAHQHNTTRECRYVSAHWYQARHQDQKPRCKLLCFVFYLYFLISYIWWGPVVTLSDRSQIIARFVLPGKSMNPHLLFHNAASNIICQVLFDRQFGYDDDFMQFFVSFFSESSKIVNGRWGFVSSIFVLKNK